MGLSSVLVVGLSSVLVVGLISVESCFGLRSLVHQTGHNPWKIRKVSGLLRVNLYISGLEGLQAEDLQAEGLQAEDLQAEDLQAEGLKVLRLSLLWGHLLQG